MVFHSNIYLVENEKDKYRRQVLCGYKGDILGNGKANILCVRDCLTYTLGLSGDSEARIQAQKPLFIFVATSATA